MNNMPKVIPKKEADMKRMIRQIIRSIIGFLDRIIVKEAERVFEFYNKVF